MTVTKRKRASAMTIVEVALALAIVTIVIVGCTMIFAAGRGQIGRQKNFRIAAQLAAEKIEDFKAGSYSDIEDDTESVYFDGDTYNRNTFVADSNSYKTVRVAVSWGASNEPNVSLFTIIAP